MLSVEESDCDIWTDYCKREEAERMGLTQKQYDRWYIRKLGKAYLNSIFKKKTINPVKKEPTGSTEALEEEVGKTYSNTEGEE